MGYQFQERGQFTVDLKKDSINLWDYSPNISLSKKENKSSSISYSLFLPFLVGLRYRGWVNNHRRLIDSFIELTFNSPLSLNWQLIRPLATIIQCQRYELVCGGNPSFKSCVEGKSGDREIIWTLGVPNLRPQHLFWSAALSTNFTFMGVLKGALAVHFNFSLQNFPSRLGAIHKWRHANLGVSLPLCHKNHFLPNPPPPLSCKVTFCLTRPPKNVNLIFIVLSKYCTKYFLGLKKQTYLTIGTN